MLLEWISRNGACCFAEFIAYIFADLRSRSDLAFAWMYQEYANMQGYNVLSVDPDKQQSSAGYDNCLTCLLSGLLDRPDHKEGSVLIISISDCMTFAWLWLLQQNRNSS